MVGEEVGCWLELLQRLVAHCNGAKAKWHQEFLDLDKHENFEATFILLLAIWAMWEACMVFFSRVLGSKLFGASTNIKTLTNTLGTPAINQVRAFDVLVATQVQIGIEIPNPSKSGKRTSPC